MLPKRIILWILLGLMMSKACTATPLGIPKQFEMLLVTVSINQSMLPGIHTIYLSKNEELWLQEDEIYAWGISQLPKIFIDYQGLRYYSMKDYSGINYQLDRSSLSLTATVSPHLIKPTFINQVVTKLNPPLRPAEPGVYLNYDLFEQRNDLLGINQSAGYTDLIYFNHWGVGSNQMLVTKQGNQKAFTRLSTSWTYDQPERMTSWRLGDSTTSSASWSGAVRFAGIQYATNFSTQPDLITFPLPSYKGVATVPSTLDVLVNDSLRYEYPINSGPFYLNHIPVVTGAGTLSVVTHDILGRQQTVLMPYYVSNQLLKPGLQDFSYEVGTLRKYYAIESNRYTDLAAVATHFIGITPCYTLGGHAEFLGRQQTIGLSNVYLYRNFIVFDLGYAVSHNEQGLGGLIELGFSRQVNQGLSFGAQTLLTSNNYGQLNLSNGILGATFNSRAFIGANLAENGNISLSYTRYRSKPPLNDFRILPNADIATLSYSRNFFNRLQLLAGAFIDVNNNQNRQGFISFIWAFDETKTINVGNMHYLDRDEQYIDVNKNLPLGNGVGYRFIAADSSNPRLQANVDINTDIATLGAIYHRLGNYSDHQVAASGSVVYFGQQLFLARHTDNSFALVQTPGFKDIGVYYRNQLIGQTDKHGNLLIPNLLPYQDNEIEIEARDFPITASIPTTKKAVLPYYKSGTLLRFKASINQSALVTLVLSNGEVVPAGALVTLKNHLETYPVGYQGLVYMEHLHESVISGDAHWEGKQCHFILTLENSDLTMFTKRKTLCASS